MRVLVGWLVVCHLGSVACILCLLFSQLLGMFNGNIMASCPSIGQQGCAACLPPTQKYNKRIWLFDVSQWKYINLFPISANAGHPLPPEGDCPVFPYVDRKARINQPLRGVIKRTFIATFMSTGELFHWNWHFDSRSVIFYLFASPGRHPSKLSIFTTGAVNKICWLSCSSIDVTFIARTDLLCHVVTPPHHLIEFKISSQRPAAAWCEYRVAPSFKFTVTDIRQLVQ